MTNDANHGPLWVIAVKSLVFTVVTAAAFLGGAALFAGFAFFATGLAVAFLGAGLAGAAAFFAGAALAAGPGQ